LRVKEKDTQTQKEKNADQMIRVIRGIAPEPPRPIPHPTLSKWERETMLLSFVKVTLADEGFID